MWKMKEGTFRGNTVKDEDRYMVVFSLNGKESKVISARGYDKAIEIAEKVKELATIRNVVRIIRDCKIYEYA